MVSAILSVENFRGTIMPRSTGAEWHCLERNSMGLYDECKQRLQGGAEPSATNSSGTDLLSTEESSISRSAFPVQILETKAEGISTLALRTVYHISDIHLFHHVMARFPNGAADSEIKGYVKEFVSNMLTDEFRKNGRYLFIGGDVSHSFKLSSIFYTELRSQLDAMDENRHYVYAILGNHELWDFCTLEECQKAYREMLEPLRITLLCNEGTYLMFRPPMRFTGWDKKTKKASWEGIDPRKEPEEFDRCLAVNSGSYLIGGTGFAEYNEEHNADTGYYRHVLNRKMEIEESEKWKCAYLDGLEKARKIRGQLIVLTHNPMQDWMGKDFRGDVNCIYFSGHNHRNFEYHNDERNVHIFADNQIGYSRLYAKVKRAELYSRGNPFAGYADEYYEIKSNDYLAFYSYLMENLQGNGIAENMISKYGCRFYMIKRSGYYGFFLISDKAAYISSGGRVKKIGARKDIQYFYANFAAMVNAYISVLSPYRHAQEQIAEAVRTFGGEGNIHGCIVDIDFENHIMLNPNDGTMTFYYSPMFGKVQTYASVGNLLEAHVPEMYNRYLAGASTTLAMYNPKAETNSIVDVEKVSGIYGMSKKIAQLQRLFSCRVLRDWNDKLIQCPITIKQ